MTPLFAQVNWETVRPYAASPLLWAMLLAMLGMWLLLPRGNTRWRPVGALLSAAALGLLASALPRFGDWFELALFWSLAALTAGSAVATISMRSPVYCAIWFAVTLLATSALFLLQGAQFLGMATIVVYAGAILVTFLFVLMLAQPEGHAFYDRISWGWIPTTFATLAGVLIVGGLAYRLSTLGEMREQARDRREAYASRSPLETQPPVTSYQSLTTPQLLHPQHMAKLGGELFSKHLVSVEVAGTLLLVALVGAVAIMIQGRETAARRSTTQNSTQGATGGTNRGQ